MKEVTLHNTKFFGKSLKSCCIFLAILGEKEIVLDKNLLIRLDDDKSIPLGEQVTTPFSSSLFVIEDIGDGKIKVQLSEEPSQEYEEFEIDDVKCDIFQCHMKNDKWKPHRYPIGERGKLSFICNW